MNCYRSLAAALAMTAAPIVAQAQTETYTVYFPLDSAQLTSEARSVVAEAAQTWRETGRAEIGVQGHTDTSGPADYNLQLSQRRAEAVAQELADQGVPRGQIDTNWVGQNNLAVQTGDGVAEARNRRALIGIGIEQPPAPAPAPVAQPQPQPEPQRDVGFRFAIAPYAAYNFGGFSDDEADESVFAGGNVTASYELTPNIVGEVEQAVFWNFWADDNSIGGRTAIGPNFQLSPGTVETGIGSVLPYAGANIGAIYGKGSIDNEFFAGPEVGLRVGPIEAKVAYDIPFTDDPWDDGAISATIGAGYRF